jgi:hypothetical protein
MRYVENVDSLGELVEIVGHVKFKPMYFCKLVLTALIRELNLVARDLLLPDSRLLLHTLLHLEQRLLLDVLLLLRHADLVSVLVVLVLLAQIPTCLLRV